MIHLLIPFNLPPSIITAKDYMWQAVLNNHLSGDGEFTKKCTAWFEDRFSCPKAMLTTSGSHALDMAASLCGLNKGDEVIMPSFTFTSTANAFVQFGAKIVFVDIRPDTMNINEALIEAAVTKKTRAIVPVHYAGVSCDMDAINAIAERHNLFVIEDAAQGVMSLYKNKALGTLSDFGCYSFHETKNYSMGEGGALLIQGSKYVERAEIIREKGTNRSKFFRGQIDKYSWVDWGSSYLPSELNAAYLWSQLEVADEINNNRLSNWNLYYNLLSPLASEECIELPHIPDYCTHNAHMFYVKTKNLSERTSLIAYLKENNVIAVYHYIPLHTAIAGKKFGVFHGEDNFTTKESERLLRLPLYYGLKEEDVHKVAKLIKAFYRAN